MVRQQPTALPPSPRNLELPRPAPPTRAIELPPPRESEAARAETRRTEPGTWREIIARFERDLGDAPEPETGGAEEAAQVPSETGGADEGAEVPPIETTAAAEAATDTGPGRPPAESADVVPAGPPADIAGTPPADESVPWEVTAMTTPDYVPPHSIHDREHDSWPVETEDGDAVPAWSDELPEEERGQDEQTAFFDEIGELLLDEVVPADPWDIEVEPDDEPDTPGEFPLDAFIVPAGVQTVGGRGTDDVAQRVAHRLDELARQLRDRGLTALGGTDSVDELSRVLAAIVTGYVTRDMR